MPVSSVCRVRSARLLLIQRERLTVTFFERISQTVQRLLEIGNRFADLLGGELLRIISLWLRTASALGKHPDYTSGTRPTFALKKSKIFCACTLVGPPLPSIHPLSICDGTPM